MNVGTPPRSERTTSAFVQAAPLAGIAFWIWEFRSHESDYAFYYVYFFPGVFMLAAGLAVALLARFASRSAFVRAQAAGSLRFHGIVALVVVAIAVVLLLSSLLDRQPWSLDNQPRHLEAAFGIAVFAFGVVLPLIEIGRSIAGAVSAWKSSYRLGGGGVG